METTKITTASVRIALSYQYSTFEISLNLDNPQGIEPNEVDEARKQAQTLATDALNDYKGQPNANQKEELKRIENKLSSIKALINEKQPEEEKQPDPKEIAAVEKLPMYGEVKKAKQTKK